MTTLIRTQALDPENTRVKVVRASTVARAIAKSGIEPNSPYIVIRPRKGKLRAIPHSKHATTRIRKDDHLLLVELPAGGGGGGGGNKLSSILSMVALIALSAVAPYLAGPLAATLGVGALGAKVLSAAIIFGGALLISTFLSPEAPKGDKKDEAYDYSPGGNAAKPFDPIQVQYGTRRTQPPYAAPPYAEYENNIQYVYQLLCLGCGEHDITRMDFSDTVFWRSTTGFEEGFEDFEIEIVPPGVDVTLFPFNVQTSGEVNGIQLEEADFIGPFSANAPGTKATKLSVDFVFPGGLQRVQTDGDIVKWSVSVQAEYRAIDDAGLPVGSYVQFLSETFNKKTTQPLRYTRSVEVPEGRYQVRFRRTSDGDDRSGTTDTLLWASLRSHITGPRSFSGVTCVAIKTRAGEDAQGSSGQAVSVLATRKIPTWNGVAWTPPVPSRSRVWAYADILRNTDYGAGMADQDLPLGTLYSLDQFYTSIGDFCDILFTGSSTVWDAMEAVLRDGRAYPLMIAGKADIVRDEAATVRRFQFTDSDIVRGSLSTELMLADEQTPDDVIVEFTNGVTWRPDEVRATLPGSAATNPTRVQAPTLTDRTLAWTYAMYLAAQNRYRRRFYTLETEWDGRLLKRGTPGKILSEFLNPETVSVSRILDAAGNTLTAEGQLKWAAEGAHYARLRDRRGRDWGPVLATRGATDSDVILDPGDLADVEAATGQTLLQTLNTADQENTRITLLRGIPTVRDVKVVSIRAQSENRVSVFLVDDDPRVYALDGTPPNNPVPPPLPVVGGRPVITGLSGSRIQVDNTVYLSASWNPAPGATRYLAQVTFDEGESWEPVYEGVASECTVPTSQDACWFRVVGIGRVQGPWSPTIQFEALVISVVLGPDSVKIENFNAALRERVDAGLRTDQEIWDAIDQVSFAGASVALRQSAQIQGAVAEVRTEVVTRATENQALAARIDTVEAELGDVEANLTVKYIAEVTPAGALVAYAVEAKVESLNDYARGGFYLIAKSDGAGGAFSEFWVDADRFLVGSSLSGLTDFVPIFAIANVDGAPKITIRGDVIADGGITARSLDVGSLSAITADVGTLTAGLIRSTDDKVRFDLTNATLEIFD